MSDKSYPSFDPLSGRYLSSDESATRPLHPPPGPSSFADAPTVVPAGTDRAGARWQPPSSQGIGATAGASGTTASKRGISRRKLLVGAGAGVVGASAIAAGLGFYLTHRDENAGAPNIFASDAGQIMHLLRR
ncbi:MAG TPA: hypothetical protein VF116_22140, partial [Ktedonobacterales bacterium]